MEKNNKTLEMIETLNNHMCASNLYIPFLEGFEIEHKPNIKNCIFIAKNDNGILEQLYIEHLKDNESLEDKINIIQNETNTYLKNQGHKTYVKFYKEYSTIFTFKTYIRDIILTDKLIRELDTYFLDEKNNDVYKLSLSYGPFKIDNNIQLISNEILNEDLITKKLNDILNKLLENIKYNI